MCSTVTSFLWRAIIQKDIYADKIFLLLRLLQLQVYIYLYAYALGVIAQGINFALKSHNSYLGSSLIGKIIPIGGTFNE